MHVCPLPNPKAGMSRSSLLLAAGGGAAGWLVDTAAEMTCNVQSFWFLACALSQSMHGTTPMATCKSRRHLFLLGEVSLVRSRLYMQHFQIVLMTIIGVDKMHGLILLGQVGAGCTK